ncbi:MAG: AI-2E family transporter [Planctomycetes bacterium]|nr:AI-2E family transporter [Planctomycetota bacterium]
MAKKKSSKPKAKKSAKSGKKPAAQAAGKTGSASAKKKTTPKPEAIVESSEQSPPKISRQTKTLPRVVKALDADYSQILGMRNVRWLIVFLAVIGALLFGWWLSDIFVPLLAAAGLAYILNPAVERIQRRGVARPRAVFWIFLCMLVSLIFIGSWFAASVVKDVQNMSAQVTDVLHDTKENSDKLVVGWNESVPEFARVEGEDLSASVVTELAHEVLTSSASDIEDTNQLQAHASMATARAELLKSFQVLDADRDLKLSTSEIDEAELAIIDKNRDGYVGTSEWFLHFGVLESPSNKRVMAAEVLDVASSGLRGLILLLLFITLVPIYTWYFMIGFDNATSKLKTYLPGRHRERIVRILGEVDDMLKAFFRGRIVVVMIIAGLSTGLFLIFGVQHPFLLGAASGLGILIPYFAFIAGMAPAIILMLVAGDSTWAIIGMSIGFLAIQGFEQYLLTPKLLGDAVELHPVTLLVGVFVMGSLFGIFGALLAVPLTAMAKTLGREFLLPYFKQLADERPSA